MSRESEILRVEIKRLRAALAFLAAAKPLPAENMSSDWRRGYADGWAVATGVTSKYARSVLDAPDGIMPVPVMAEPGINLRLAAFPIGKHGGH